MEQSRTTKPAPAPVVPETPAQTAPETTSTTNNTEDYELKNRNVIRVTRGEKNRYYFEVDGEPFASYNKNNEACESNSFSLDLTTLTKQVGNKNELLNMAFTMASVNKDGILNPQIVALCLNNATITATRIHKDANDIRETGVEGDTYGKNTWKTIITDMKSNISAFAQQALIQLIMNPKTLTIKEEPEKPSIQDVFANLG